MILDPRDEEIDREFGIDRSKPGIKPPTITERIKKSAYTASYELVKVDTVLPHDYIFILEPQPDVKKKSARAMMQNFDLMYEQLRPKE